jgi:hypothetical protein
MSLRKLTFAIAALTAASLFAVGATAHAQVGKKKSGDKRIAAALDEAELKYEVDNDGDFKLTFELENGRTQMVFINSKTAKLGELEIRNVWSPAMATEGPLDAEVANALLVENDQVKLGGWRVEANANGKRYAFFAAQIDAEADGDTLKQVLEAVVENADAKEKELTNGDMY